MKKAVENECLMGLLARKGSQDNSLPIYINGVAVGRAFLTLKLTKHKSVFKVTILHNKRYITVVLPEEAVRALLLWRDGARPYVNRNKRWSVLEEVR